MRKLEAFIGFIFCCVLLFVSSISVSAQTTTWNGSVSSEWSNPANWSNGVPTATGTARIDYFPPSNSDPVITANTTVGSLQIGNFGRQIHVTVSSGVEVEFNNLSIASTGTPGQIALDVANGNVIVNNTMTLNGGIYVDGGSITFLDNFTMNSSALFDIQTGVINVGDPGPPVVSADFIQTGGSTFNLNQGSLNIYGNSEFTGGGKFNAGSGNINLNGNIEFNGGSEFSSDSSTVNVNGPVTISSNSNQDANFYNLNVNDGADVNADIDVTVYNNMDVNDNSDYEQETGTNLNVVGDVSGEPSVESPRPYIVSIQILTPTSIRVIFNQEVTEGPAETASNYDVKAGVMESSTLLEDLTTAPVLGGAGNREVTISFNTITITQGSQFFLHVKNVTNLAGQSVNNPHVKRFLIPVPPTFYSRQSGNWSSNATWSTVSHTGAAANNNPTNTPNSKIIVGNGNTITVASSASITSLDSIVVDNSSALLVDNGATLQLGTKVIRGNGTFEVQSGTLEIGSPAGISSSGASGNIRTANRIFSSNASYTYNGTSSQITGTGLPTTVQNFTVNNTSNVTASDNLEVEGTLSLNSGSLRIPSGQNLIANTKNISSGDLIMERTITGTTGWRMVSSPLATTFQDLFDNTVTQGYPGAYYSTGSNPGDTLQPNVLFYDETYATNIEGNPATDNQRWRAPVDASNTINAGTGLYTFFFGDIDADPLYNNTFDFPITLSVQGQENEGDGSKVDLGVTYTPEADSGWNLIGNPYAATIDWDDASNWNRSNIDNTIYVWDTDVSTYKTWNGVAGDLDSQGLIAPFQSFWVKANGSNPELDVFKEAKTFGGIYVGKQMNTDHSPVVSLKISGNDYEASTHFMFSEIAKLGKDPFDAYYLPPPPGINSYININSTTADGSYLNINNLPRYFGRPIEIPIYIEAFENGFSVDKELGISLGESKNIPQGWSVQLVDNKTKAKINLNNDQPYRFRQKTVASKQASGSSSTKRTKVSKNSNARFTLLISPGEDAANLPSEFVLEQNYPNPFNPATNIQFSLPVQSRVNLTIFNMLGQKVTTLVSNELPAGTHTYNWDASGVSSGIYLYRLATQNAVLTNKMTLIK